MLTTVPAPPAPITEAELAEIMLRWTVTPPARTPAWQLFIAANADIARLVAAVRQLRAVLEDAPCEPV